MCSCSYSCSWSASSSLWRCFGVVTGSIVGLLIHEEGPSAPRCNVFSSPAAQTIAPPVVSPPLPRRVESLRLGLCVPGARSKAAGEHPNSYTPKATPVPISSARTSGSPTLTCMRSLAMASMVNLSGSRRSVVRLAAPRSALDVTPCAGYLGYPFE
jgi:hypothetical protein